MEKDEFILIMLARTETEADFYETLLEDHDIPVRVGWEHLEGSDAEGEKGIPVLVPADQAEEAALVIEQREEFDEEFEEELLDYEDGDDDLEGYGTMEISEGGSDIDYEEEDEEDLL